MGLYTDFVAYRLSQGEYWASTDKIDTDEVQRRIKFYKNWQKERKENGSG